MSTPVSSGEPATAGLPYHLIHRGGRPGVWRPLVGTLALAASFLVIVPVLVQLPFAVGFAIAGRPVVDSMERLIDLNDPTPLGLAYLNIALACAIPVTWLITRVLHGVRPRWLASVLPRIRWGWLVTCFGLSLVALVATLVVSALVPAQGEGTDMGGGLNDFTSTIRDFLFVVVLLTPLQAAGEEYAFRGYLTQAFGGIFGRPWAAVLFPALLFALAHGAQSAPVFFDRFAFGDLASTLNPVGGSWWTIPVTLTQSLVYLALVLLVARRRGLRTTTEIAAGQGVLVAPRGRV